MKSLFYYADDGDDVACNIIWLKATFRRYNVGRCAELSLFEKALSSWAHQKSFCGRWWLCVNVRIFGIVLSTNLLVRHVMLYRALVVCCTNNSIRSLTSCSFAYTFFQSLFVCLVMHVCATTEHLLEHRGFFHEIPL